MKLQRKHIQGNLINPLCFINLHLNLPKAQKRQQRLLYCQSVVTTQLASPSFSEPNTDHLMLTDDDKTSVMITLTC